MRNKKLQYCDCTINEKKEGKREGEKEGGGKGGRERERDIYIERICTMRGREESLEAN